MRLACMLGVALAGGACGGDDGMVTPPAPDAAPALPGPEAYLAPSAYDCTASGPFLAPARPHPPGCFADPTCSARLAAGHRFANAFAPENSLSALRAAILLGVDVAETDVRATADGQVVFLHDSSIERTTTGNGEIDTLTFAEARGFALLTETGDPAGDFACERLPSLDEVFALAAGQIVVEMEVKSTQGGILAAEYLRDHGLLDDAFMLCGMGECEAVRAAVPEVKIMTRPEDATQMTWATSFTPPAIMIHIDTTPDFFTVDVIDAIHAHGAKVFGNGFVIGDGLAAAQSDLTGYLGLYDDGLDIEQAEWVHYLLQALGRIPAP